jgi:hypothetical protein
MVNVDTQEELFKQVALDVMSQAQQLPSVRVEVIWDSHSKKKLIDTCSGTYALFLSVNDILSPSFLKTFVPMLASGVEYDCASLRGVDYVQNKPFYDSCVHTSITPSNLVRTSILRTFVEENPALDYGVLQSRLKTEYDDVGGGHIYYRFSGDESTRMNWLHRWNEAGNLESKYEGPVVVAAALAPAPAPAKRKYFWSRG